MTATPMQIQLFYCSNSLTSSELTLMLSRFQGAQVRATSLPCSGKIDQPYLLKAFETGVDAVLMATCGEGTCRFLEGNLRARKRVESTDDLLDEIGLGRGRITAVQLGADEGVP